MIVDTTTGKDVFGTGWNARSRVEEYGGGAAIAYRGLIYFSNFGDLQVYKVDVGKGGEPVAVTPGNPSLHRMVLALLTMKRLVLAGVYREQEPSICGFHCIAYPPSPPGCDSGGSYTSGSIGGRNLSRTYQHLHQDCLAGSLWSGFLRFA